MGLDWLERWMGERWRRDMAMFMEIDITLIWCWGADMSFEQCLSFQVS